MVLLGCFFTDLSWFIDRCIMEFMETPTPTIADLLAEVAALRAQNQDLAQQLADLRSVTPDRPIGGALVDRLPHLVYVYDLLEDRNIYVNHQIGAALGYTAAQIQAFGSRLLIDLIHPDDLPTMLASRQRLATLGDDEPVETVFRMRHAAGGWRHLADRATIFQRTPDGRPSHTVGVAVDITRQWQVEEALRESQIVIQGLIDHSPSGIFVKDLSGRMLVVNAALAESLGMDRATMIGRHQAELFTPQSVAQWQAEDALITATGRTLTFEEVIERADQPSRRFLISKFPLMHADGTIFAIGGISTDITVRRQMEQALEERERTARALLNAPTDEIVLITPQGIISDANLAFAFANATTREALIGCPLEEVCDLECVAWLPDLLTCLTDQRTPIRFESRRADRYFDHLLAPILDTHGELASVAIFTRDITALKRGAIERLHMERRLLETQRMESIGVLAGGIAHDFNNLLTSVLGHAELLLLDLPTGSPEYAGAEAIITAVRRAADLTGQLLAYAGKGRFVVEPVQLDDLVGDTIELLRAAVPRQITLSHTIGGAVPAIEADPTQVRQVLLSLVRNAGEAIGDAAGAIDVKIHSVALTRAELDELVFGAGLPPGTYVELAVHDTSPGMDAGTLARIFDPFFTTRFTGRGLGLPAAQGIVRSHRGALRVQSAPGAGTRVQIWWPAMTVRMRAEPESPSVPPARPARGVALVVDDEPGVLQVLARLLRTLGFQVESAGSGPEVLDLLEREDLNPVVALVDLTMPQMDGVAVAKALRQERPATQVVLMSGYSAAEIAESCAGLSIAGFLQKPFQLAALRSTLSQILG